MSMKVNRLFEFLYNESQVSSELDDLPKAMTAMLEDLDHQETLSTKRQPLATALKKVGVTSGLSDDPEGFCLVTKDQNEYLKALQGLQCPDNIHRLAELGWITVNVGDTNSPGEEPEYRIRFLELTTVDTEEDKESLENVIKAAREFATEPMEREDEFTKPKGDGVGKATDGKPPGASESTIDDLLPAPPGSLSNLVSEAVRRSERPKSKPMPLPDHKPRRRSKGIPRLKQALNNQS